MIDPGLQNQPLDAAGVDPQLLEEIKLILRRDLKLGAAAVIADDMPLIGGEMDLDSLDILLLVSSIEKHFSMKIPNEVVGRWAFQNVATLTKFVQENRAASQPPAPAARNPIDRLPHGPAFRFVSKIFDIVPGQSARGAWILDGSEPFFAAHFPNRPIVPGVLIAEALAQLSGLTVEENTGKSGGVLAHVDLKFEAPVAPPATIELHATLARSMGALRMFTVSASVNGASVTRGTLALKVL